MLTGKKKIIRASITYLIVFTAAFFLGAAIGVRPLSTLKEKPILGEVQTKSGETSELIPVSEVMNYIKERYVKEVPPQILIRGAINGMVQALEDPYSVFMEPEEFEDFMISLNGSFEGVGLSLDVDEETGEIIVVAPIEGTPAHKAGIRPRDRIVKVDGVELKGKSIDEAVKLLRGKKGTKVTVYVERPGVKEILKYELVRDDIRLKTVKWDIIENDIGYVRISSFDSYTSEEFENALTALQQKGIKALVLDLRDNPGGDLDEAVRVADMLMGKGLVVFTRDRYGNKLEEYYSDDASLELPLAVLINENSASAAEIVSGALQDSKKAVLVGKRTFGKGTVQELMPLNDGSGLKMTIAKYYLPSGRSIDGKGVEPDVEVSLKKVESSSYEIPINEDEQLKKAVEILKTKF
ncbi:carboxyl-terminal processing protease [Caldanaerovirga acetigignens]|uniref:Carboxyl-terminal processing protease n=1 Tax=Caldanaerovirga acetigignens TaxID=447595 RepID=A0A1M7JWV0_9FIRM|nr:S41 family peptidase [Caldanaerovirga acetigignens]SHM57550.1 carboxyl-terminal processing protease [Caldanaerovirga acetigignens]